MARYIGCKTVEAEPCKARHDIGNHKVGDDGYKVTYPDGYVSWSPKDVFEKAYIETPYKISQEDCLLLAKAALTAFSVNKIMQEGLK